MFEGGNYHNYTMQDGMTTINKEINIPVYTALSSRNRILSINLLLLHIHVCVPIGF